MDAIGNMYYNKYPVFTFNDQYHFYFLQPLPA